MVDQSVSDGGYHGPEALEATTATPRSKVDAREMAITASISFTYISQRRDLQTRANLSPQSRQKAEKRR